MDGSAFARGKKEGRSVSCGVFVGRVGERGKRGKVVYCTLTKSTALVEKSKAWKRTVGNRSIRLRNGPQRTLAFVHSDLREVDRRAIQNARISKSSCTTTDLSKSSRNQCTTISLSSLDEPANGAQTTAFNPQTNIPPKQPSPSL